MTVSSKQPQGRVLIIAGSDSGGGAGIQADIKAVTAMKGYAATAITAVTVQNTLGVTGIHDIPLDIIADQISVVLEDIGADAIKTGMLAHAPVIRVVAERLHHLAPKVPLIVDPVMVATSGARLIDDDAHEAIIRALLPRATLITPNLPEAEVLSGMTITDTDGMADAGKKLLDMGAGAVLVKGGHLPGPSVIDLLVTRETIERYEFARIETMNTHGTGCTLASAISALIAQGVPLIEAVRRARAYVWRAIETAPGFGAGHGPLNHAHVLDPTED